MAPRKTRLLVALVRGMNIAAARAQLTFSKKQSSLPILKVLNSAVANATQNLKLDPETLVVTKAWVDEGPSFFRYAPKAHGRAAPVRHRMSHITIVVAAKEVAKVESKKTTTAKAPKSSAKGEKKA